MIEVKLPAALFVGREFVVDGELDAPADRIAQFRAFAAPPGEVKWDPKLPLVASADSPSYKRLVRGYSDFRKVFPTYLCFPQIVPNDEPTHLKRWHREDDELARLFLTAEDKQKLERLWAEHRHFSRQPVVELDALTRFVAALKPPQPKELLVHCEQLREVLQNRVEELRKEEDAARPKQFEALMEFAPRAFRRPLLADEKTELRTLYDNHKKDAGPEAAVRAALAHVLSAQAFVFRGEQGPKRKESAAVSDHELATRLSYFLWAAPPDAELRALAATGKLRDPKVLAEQAQWMIKDDRTRALAVEFGAQWMRVRGFEEFKAKSTNRYWPPSPDLCHALAEEPIQFFLDLFQNDRPVTNVVGADYAFLNSTLSHLYQVPEIQGNHFRKVDGVQKHGRGGVLGFGSVHAKHIVAFRGSPSVRGKWVLEVLLGETVGAPPEKVPEIPRTASIRQLLEKHAKDQACAGCHSRIDPLGFALEKYDQLGRPRTPGFGGAVIDTKVKLKDGTVIDGIDGLRKYLLTEKKDVVTRQFCRKLLGYALGRTVTFSDTAMLDEMVSELNKNDGKVSAAMLAILRSPQFRMARGSGSRE